MRAAAALLAGALCVLPDPVFGSITQAQEDWLLSIARVRAPPGEWPDLSAAQVSDLERKAAEYERIFEERHLAGVPAAQMVEIWYRSGQGSPVVSYDDVGDSACWTGHYLSAMAHKFAVTRDRGALEAIHRTLGAYELTTNCTTKPGYLVRFLGETDDPAFRRYYTGYPSVHLSSISSNATWLGAESRDQYLGVALGLASTYALVDVPDVRDRVRRLVELLVDTLINDFWWIKSPVSEDAVNPTPAFVAAYMRLALSVNPAKYKHVFLPGQYALTLRAALAVGTQISTKWEMYFPNNLCMIALYVLGLLEDDSALRSAIVERLRRIAFEDGLDHLQVTYPVMYLIVSGAQESPDPQVRAGAELARGLVQGLLADFPEPPKVGKRVDQRDNPKYLPHHDATSAEYALLPRDRPPMTFMWQRSPVALVGGDSADHEFAAIDSFYGYWLARYAGAVPEAS